MTMSLLVCPLMQHEMQIPLYTGHRWNQQSMCDVVRRVFERSYTHYQRKQIRVANGMAASQEFAAHGRIWHVMNTLGRRRHNNQCDHAMVWMHQCGFKVLVGRRVYGVGSTLGFCEGTNSSRHAKGDCIHRICDTMQNGHRFGNTTQPSSRLDHLYI